MRTKMRPITVRAIRFSLDKPGYVSLTVTDLLGGEVARLAGERQAVGNHSVTVDVRALPGGTCILTLRQNGRKVTRSMYLAR